MVVAKDIDSDPLAEVDLYMEMQRYATAEQLLRDLLAEDPACHAYLFKLLRLYYLTENYDSLRTIADALHGLMPLNLSETELKDVSRIVKKTLREHPLLKSLAERDSTVQVSD